MRASRAPRYLVASWLCVFAGFGSFACESDQVVSSSEDELVELTEEEKNFFGDDRVGAALRDHSERIPANLAEVEVLFGVGRACTRTDSKEMFVVEESRTRLPSGDVVPAGRLVPRVVVAGCNTGDLTDPASVARSRSMFVALVSDPARAVSSGDSLLLEPVEVMAFDATASTYNFYVFGKGAKGKREVTRIYESDDGAVFERRLRVGARPTAPVTLPGDEKRCFHCHVHGAPIMNEMRDPWTNWISFKKDLPVSELAGVTQEIVIEATPNALTHRSSLANDLEPIVRSAIRAHVRGSSKVNGWASRMVGTKEGVGRLLASVFCETELNYASATDAVPLEVYVDPDVSSGDLVPPASFGNPASPIQFPIRSEFDRAVEGWLIDRGYLSHEIAVALRLFDDENDVFSDARCKLHPNAVAAIAASTDPADVPSLLREYLLARADEVDFVQTQPKRHAYLRALLAPNPDEVDVDGAYAAYNEELSERFGAMVADASRITSRDVERKKRARAMFPGNSSPLPILP